MQTLIPKSDADTPSFQSKKIWLSPQIEILSLGHTQGGADSNNAESDIAPGIWS